VRRTGLLLATGALAVVGLRVGMVEPVRVSGDSMAPTLGRGAVVLVDKLDRDPSRGDLVTFDSPVDGRRTLKRVVGTAGDVVAVRDAVLHVNGRPVDEPYVDHASVDGWYYGPVTVPEATVLVLGDRRAGSIDSRSYGPLPVEAVTGRVALHLWG